MQHTAREEFKKQGRKCFLFLPRNHCCPSFRLLSYKQAAQLCRKSKEGEDRKSRKSSRVSNRLQNESQLTEVESERTLWGETSGERKLEEGGVEVEEGEEVGERVERGDVSISHRLSLDLLMEKYLGKEKNEQEDTVTLVGRKGDLCFFSPAKSKSPFTRSKPK